MRLRRKELGITQEQLADSLGLTFQQVQKYERGANRISASRLYEIARTLKTPITYFFEGLPEPTDERGVMAGDHINPSRFLLTGEGVELAQLFPEISDRRVRRQVLALVRTLAEAAA